LKLIVHIGHGKTGSSFIQSRLASNQKKLNKIGIFYPVFDRRQAEPVISSGNAFDAFSRRPKAPLGTDIYLISNESIAQAIGRGQYLDQILALKNQIGARTVEFVLYVRDPIEHAQSAYQQSVKRSGNARDVQSFFETYILPLRLVQSLDAMETAGLSTIHFFNYSRHKANSIAPLATLLDAPFLNDPEENVDQVNRSMTLGELTLLRSINEATPYGTNFLSDALCNELPQIPSDTAFPSEETQQAMLERLRDALEKIDSKLPMSEKYDYSLKTPATFADGCVFGPDHLQFIGNTIGKYMAELQIAKQLADLAFLLSRVSTVSGDAEKNKVLRQTETLVSKIGETLDFMTEGQRVHCNRLQIEFRNVSRVQTVGFSNAKIASSVKNRISKILRKLGR